MEYGLARMTLASRDFLPLTRDEYDAILQAKVVLLECLFIEQKFDLVVANYIEFETALLESTVHHTVLGHHDYETLQIELASFNRRMVNLLTAGRTYVDQVPRHCCTVDPSSADALKTVQAAQYDAHLGYRVVSALRNHVQHYGLPIHSVTFGSRRIDDGDEFALRHTVGPFLKVDALRANPKFKKSVLHELEALGDKCDVKSLVRDYVEGLWGVHSEVRRRVSTIAPDNERVLAGAIARFNEYSDDGGSSLSVVVREGGQVVQSSHVFTDFVDLRKLLERRNGTLVNLAYSYVSSEVVPEAEQARR